VALVRELAREPPRLPGEPFLRERGPLGLHVLLDREVPGQRHLKVGLDVGRGRRGYCEYRGAHGQKCGRGRSHGYFLPSLAANAPP